MKMLITFCFLFFFINLCISTATSTVILPVENHRRHLLHQPFFPVDSHPPTQPPISSPQSQPEPAQQPKLPFSSSSSTPPPQKPFFPSFHSPPPPPSPTALTSFPANISSLLFPQPSSTSHRHVLAIAVSVSLLSAGLIVAFAAALFYYLRHRKLHNNSTNDDKESRSDSLRLYPANTATSDGDGGHNKSRATPNRSSEFLYLGTLVSSRGGVDQETASKANSSNAGPTLGVSASPYQKLGSPELKPLPPLPKHNCNLKQSFRSSSLNDDDDNDNDGGDGEEEFFSPRGSTESPSRNGSSSRRVLQSFEVDNLVSRSRSRSFNSRTPSYPCSKSASPATSISNTLSPSKSPDLLLNFPPPSRPPPLPLCSSPTLSSSSSANSRYSKNSRNSDAFGPEKHSPAATTATESVPKLFLPIKLPPPPPPLPPPRFWEIPATTRSASGPPVLVTPSGPVAFESASLPAQDSQNSGVETGEIKNDQTPKPKLKPLHWDKVRASSDRAMVWDQLKSSSFQLNEEMIETLFMVNNSNLTPKDNARKQVLPSLNLENRVLDPKKSQNIAILLRALNVTFDEVCESLMEGNSDTLGTELLESLLKMAPTKEEERKLKDFKDESPSKLGPAEKFLKSVLDIPFAFKRIEALLYIANFDSEVEYLKRSFETLEVACEELRNSRMFLKLLEAVLKTGNRMNVGTNRGDAHAFKLDTLLKLVDVKGTDGKTTLLHFVVQEIIRAEGSGLSGSNQNEAADNGLQSSFRDDVEFRKLGLQVVSGLSGELTNVKKAAAMDSDVLSKEVAKLAGGITKIAEVLKLNEAVALKESSWKFSESMNGFLKKAEEDIMKLQAQEKYALSLVKEITEYFHGNSAKEEAHPFRIFTVVRDFLSILDHVCKEVGKVNERTIMGSARQFPMAMNQSVPIVFPGLNRRQYNGSSDDERSSSS
ncbi:formin-like protein 2 [Ziziphus jujuba]|uniref:Formin-like protein n=1 Tax=Ziziphus jujuba TaxID=326968 RepID=A0A6P3Z4R2_ZIZJJ|nr:formin-like protein 2 [Ziziphus jujuba]